MTRTALEHRPRFNLGRRFDSEFGSKHPGHKTPAYGLSAIGYRLFAQRWLSVIRAALAIGYSRSVGYRLFAQRWAGALQQQCNAIGRSQRSKSQAKIFG
jgi:hypothetical protein